MRKTTQVAAKGKLPKVPRQGKLPVTKCLDKFLLLVKALEREAETERNWFSKIVVGCLKELLISIDNFNGKKQAIEDVSATEKYNKFGQLDEIEVKTKYQRLSIKDEELLFLLRLMQIFKIETYEGCEHFNFISEDRHIKTVIEHDFESREVTADDAAKLHEIWIPEKYLYDNARNSMHWGGARMEVDKHIFIKSSQEIHYTIKPYSEFGKMLLSKNSFPANKNLDQYKIPSINDIDSNSIITLSQVIFVAFYIINGGFYNILICDECNSLFLRKHNIDTNEEEVAITCSDKCYKQIWKRKNPLSAAREDCFNNQREWIKSNLYENSINETSVFCKDCPLDLRKIKLSRGECPFLCELYGEQIEAKFYNTTGRNYLADICRKRQNQWFSSKLGKEIYTKKKFCDDCPLTFFPRAGGCPSLCKKYEGKIAAKND